MKQRIDVKQLTELTHEQKLRLLSLWLPQNGDFYVWYEVEGGTGKEIYIMDNGFLTEDSEANLFALPLLSIGQMIECLQEIGMDWTLNGSSWGEPDICDRLWERLKHYL